MRLLLSCVRTLSSPHEAHDTEGIRMATPDKSLNGVPCWIDLTTSNLEAAKSFYSDLFGWSIEDAGEEYGHYQMASLDGKGGVAGMIGKTPEMGEAPDAWLVYFASGDAAATEQTIRDNGGQVMVPTMDVMDLGKMLVATDPAGAAFGIWQRGAHTGFGVIYEPGTPGWFEGMSLDFDAATAFYRNVLGVTMQDEDTGEGGPPYQTMNVNGEPYAGLMDATGLMPEGVPSNWLVYFLVEDTDAAVAKAQELGGSVMAPAADSPHGRFALLGDPTGAAFAIISMQGESAGE